jgi:putative sigma-54 modulation protein
MEPWPRGVFARLAPADAGREGRPFEAGPFQAGPFRADPFRAKLAPGGEGGLANFSHRQERFMQYSVTFRHMEPSEHLKEYGRDKLAKLEKYLDSVLDADVTFTVEKFRHKAEVVVTSDGLKIKAEEVTEDMYSALDLVVDKLEKQIKRRREKAKGLVKTPQKRSAGGDGPSRGEPDEAEADLPEADKTRDLTVSRMAFSEAAELLAHSANPFVVYLDEADGGLRLLHQQAGGSLELLRLNV